MIAVNQDELGAKGRLVVRHGTTEVWAKDLAGGRKAVALFNRGAADATAMVDLGRSSGSPASARCATCGGGPTCRRWRPARA